MRQAEAEAHAAALSDTQAKLDAQKLCTTAAEQAREQAQVSFDALVVVDEECMPRDCWRCHTVQLHTLQFTQNQSFGVTRCLLYQVVISNGRTTTSNAM